VRKSNGSEAFPRRQEQNQRLAGTGKRSQEKSKRVLKFVKVSTTKEQAPQAYISFSNGEVFSEKDFLKERKQR
jgi:hypothetical protein